LLWKALTNPAVTLEVSGLGSAVWHRPRIFRPTRQFRALAQSFAWGYYAAVTRKQLRTGRFLTASAFPLPKADRGTARVIVWPGELNDRRPYIYSGLQPLLQLFALLRKYPYARTFDAVSAFNQFLLALAVSRLFTLRLRRPLQGSRHWCQRRLPMGWRPSVAICQRTYRCWLALIGLLAFCFLWVDNLLVVGASPAELHARTRTLMASARAYGMSWKPETQPSETHLIHLGLEIWTLRQEYSFKPSFCQKATAILTYAARQPDVSFKAFQVLVGVASWIITAANLSLLHIKHLLWGLGDEAAARHRGLQPGGLPPATRVALTSTMTAELKELVPLLSKTFPFPRETHPTTLVEVTTDASSTGGGAVWHCGPSGCNHTTTKVLAASAYPWPPDLRGSHINCLEMRALLQELSDPAWPGAADPSRFPPGTNFRWNADSKVCLRALFKKWTSSRQLADPLEQVVAQLEKRGFHLEGHHVASKENIADRPSRLWGSP